MIYESGAGRWSGGVGRRTWAGVALGGREGRWAGGSSTGWRGGGRRRGAWRRVLGLGWSGGAGRRAWAGAALGARQQRQEKGRRTVEVEGEGA